MVVFTLGSDSGFQIGADGILDDYDDEGGISVILWCIIFVFLLVVTVWFYITQLAPSKASGCEVDEEDEDERVANKLLDHIGGKNDRTSSNCYEDDTNRPSTSRQSSDNYEVIDGEIRIHHSSYECRNEPCSKGNATVPKETSDALVRRHSMEEMSLIFPGFLPSITEEEEYEDAGEREDHKEPCEDVCRIGDLERDTVESCPNASSDTNVYIDANKSPNPCYSDQRDTMINGRTLTNRKGKLPAKSPKAMSLDFYLGSNHGKSVSVTEQKVSANRTVLSNIEKPLVDKDPKVYKTAVLSGERLNDNKVKACGTGKTLNSSQSTKTFNIISGPKTFEFDLEDTNSICNTSEALATREETTRVTVETKNSYGNADNDYDFPEKVKTTAAISASGKSEGSVERSVNSRVDGDFVSIERSNAPVHIELGSISVEERQDKRKDSAQRTSSAMMNDISLPNGISSNKSWTDSEHMMVDNLTAHAWTFYPIENSEINDNQEGSNCSEHKQNQSTDIPHIVVEFHEDERGIKFSDVDNVVMNGTSLQMDEQIDSFETDIDVDDVDLEEEERAQEGELNMFFKRHVSVTDLDKIFSSTEVAEDLDKKTTDDQNLQNIMREIIEVDSVNKPVYIESSLDDIWGDHECINKDGNLVTEMSDEMSSCPRGKERGYNFSAKTEGTSSQTVWTTIHQVPNDATSSGKDQQSVDRGKDLNDNSTDAQRMVCVRKMTNGKERRARKEMSTKTSSIMIKPALIKNFPQPINDLKKKQLENDGHKKSFIKNVSQNDECKITDNYERGDKKTHTMVADECAETIAGLESTLSDGRIKFKNSSTADDNSTGTRGTVNLTRADVGNDAGNTSKDGMNPEENVREPNADDNTSLTKTRAGEEGSRSSRMPLLQTRETKRDEMISSRELSQEKVDLHQPVSSRRHDEVVYGRKKVKKENNYRDTTTTSRNYRSGLDITSMSRKRDKVTSVATSAPVDFKQLENNTKANDKKDTGGSYVLNSRKYDEKNQIDTSIRSNVEEKITATATTRKYELPVEPEVSKLVDSARAKRLSDSTTASDEDVKLSMKPEENDLIKTSELSDARKDLGSDTNSGAESLPSYRIERKDVHTNMEKSVFFNPEKKELQTLITIGNVPDTHIGLKIGITGCIDVANQNKPITGLEKAEQIVANRLKRIEAEKQISAAKSQEKNLEERGTNWDGEPRNTNYNASQSRCEQRVVEKAVTEVVACEVSNSRQVNWEENLLDDMMLDELDVTAHRRTARTEGIDLKYHIELPRKNKTNGKKIVNDEIVTPARMTPRELDWTLLEYDDVSRDKPTTRINKDFAGVPTRHDLTPKDSKTKRTYSDRKVEPRVRGYESRYANNTKLLLKKYQEEELPLKEERIKDVAHVAIETRNTSHTPQGKKERDAEKKQQDTGRQEKPDEYKPRSDRVRKELTEELPPNCKESAESSDENSQVSPPNTHPEFPVRLTKSYSELRSVDSRSHGDDFTPLGKQNTDEESTDDSVFTEPSERVFKTKITFDEVYANKRRIVILNVRKKSSGNARWKSLNDIDSLSTVQQKQVFKFRSIGSCPEEDQQTDVESRTELKGGDGDAVFAVSGSGSALVSDHHKSSPSLPVSAERMDRYPNSASTDAAFTGRSEKDELEDRRTSFDGQRVRSPKETVFAISGHSPIPGQMSRNKDVPSPVEIRAERGTYSDALIAKESEFRKDILSPTLSLDSEYSITRDETAQKISQSPIHRNRETKYRRNTTSPTGTLFAISRQSPTPSLDAEIKNKEGKFIERQSSLVEIGSPREANFRRTASPTGTIFALSRHSPLPSSEFEIKEDKSVQRSLSLVDSSRKKDKNTRHRVTVRSGTIFALSRKSPATSDSESQRSSSTSPTQHLPRAKLSREIEDKSTTKQPKRDTVVPTRGNALTKKEDKFVSLDTKTAALHQISMSKRKKEWLESAPKGSKGTEEKITTVSVIGHAPTTNLEKERQISSSKRCPSERQKVPLDNLDQSLDSEYDYRITEDGWLEKSSEASLASSSNDENENRAVKVTDLDSLLNNSAFTKSSGTREQQLRTKTSHVEHSTVMTKLNNKVTTRRSVVVTSSKLGKRSPTRITSTGIQETDLDALFSADKDLVGAVTTSQARGIKNSTAMYSTKNHATPDKLGSMRKTLPVVTDIAKVHVIQAVPMNESPVFGDPDDDVFLQTPQANLTVQKQFYSADGTYSSDADSETSSLNSVPLKTRNRHTRSSLEAVRPTRSSLSSDSSSATPISSLERGDPELSHFFPPPCLTSTPERLKSEESQQENSPSSRKAAKESGHVHQNPAEGNSLLMDSSYGTPQRITRRAHSESQVTTREFGRSAFVPVRSREKERKSHEHTLHGNTDGKEFPSAVYYGDSGPERSIEPVTTFKEMADSHKSMPDLHVHQQNDSDDQSKTVPYHSRLSAHTRLWLSQTAGIDTSNLCKNESVGSEIFLFPSNRFQPGKSVDASFLSLLSDTEDVPDDVSTRPSSPMSEFSYAGETPFGGGFEDDVTVITCDNTHCVNEESVRGHDKTSFTSCPSCYTYYCSRECRCAHWRQHKKVCYFGRINSYMRSFVYFCHKKENLRLLLSKIATKNFTGKGRGCVMITFASPKQARKFMTSGCVLLPSPPSYSTVRDISREGVVSKHKVNLLQQVKDYDAEQELVLNLAIVAGRIEDLPQHPVPRHKLSTVLQCVKIPLSTSLVEQRPNIRIPDTTSEVKVFYLPKCSRHEFVNDMEARRHYCRIISKGLKLYGIRMKSDYPDAYDSLCQYVEKNIPFKPITVYGNRESKIIECKIMPESSV